MVIFIVDSVDGSAMTSKSFIFFFLESQHRPIGMRKCLRVCIGRQYFRKKMSLISMCMCCLSKSCTEYRIYCVRNIELTRNFDNNDEYVDDGDDIATTSMITTESDAGWYSFPSSKKRTILHCYLSKKFTLLLVYVYLQCFLL